MFSFQWSDEPPLATQESDTLTAFSQQDFDDPVISSAEYNSSPQLGVSGEKEGPYDWVPPNYWYDTTHFDKKDSTQTNAGGSWGYDSEQSAGDTIPTMDSLNRFMTSTELSNLWQSSSYNQYHANYEPTCNNNYNFGTLCHFNAALDARYGTPTSLAQYVEEAQAQNYENTRAQFEAFIDHANNTPLPSTGTIYWQMNKGWPSLLWFLWNNDGDQAGSYFGAQEANRSLHALYALDNGTVTLDNLSNTSQSGLTVESKVYNLAGTVTDDQTSPTETLASQHVLNNVLTPKVPTTPAGTTYFVELLLKQNGTLIDRNVYWLSTTKDAVNWSKSLGKPVGVISTYANLTGLQSLPQSGVSASATTTQQAGPDGADLATTVTITNTSSSTVAFLLRADVRRGTASGGLLSGDNELQSSIWQGNDITLFPGESQTLTVTYDSSDLGANTPVITLSGWNVPQVNIPGPCAVTGCAGAGVARDSPAPAPQRPATACVRTTSFRSEGCAGGAPQLTGKESCENSPSIHGRPDNCRRLDRATRRHESSFRGHLHVAARARVRAVLRDLPRSQHPQSYCDRAGLRCQVLHARVPAVDRQGLVQPGLERPGIAATELLRLGHRIAARGGR